MKAFICGLVAPRPVDGSFVQASNSFSLVNWSNTVQKPNVQSTPQKFFNETNWWPKRNCFYLPWALNHKHTMRVGGWKKTIKITELWATAFLYQNNNLPQNTRQQNRIKLTAYTNALNPLSLQLNLEFHWGYIPRIVKKCEFGCNPNDAYNCLQYAFILF